MKASDLLVECLENECVEFIFGIVGKEILEIAESLSTSRQIQFLNVRHEQGASFMADVYGRLSKKPGVCLSTLGPGATNLITGTASAQLDHSPLIAIIGQAEINRHHQESHQYLNLPEIFGPITKWSKQIDDPHTLPTVIRKAFKLSLMEKPGAVAIVIPENILTGQTANLPLAFSPLPDTVPSQAAIDAARLLIKNHSKPFLLVGNGVVRQDAVEELRTFIEFLKCPVSHTFMAKGVLEPGHPQNYFTFGFSENDEVLSGINEADLLITVGLDFVETLPSHWNKKKLPVLHIDSLPAETNSFYPVAAELVGNIRLTLQLLNQSGLTMRSWEPAENLKARIARSFKINTLSASRETLPLKMEYILQSIHNSTGDDTVLISDVGAHKMSIAKTFQPKNPGRLIISNGLASMGIAIPGCIGAKLACPDSTVICITGDGGALMNFAEIETAKRLGLSFLVIIINDGMLKLEVQQMEKKFGESYGTSFQNPDMVTLASSFGITGLRVATLAEFESALSGYLSSPGGITMIVLEMENPGIIPSG